MRLAPAKNSSESREKVGEGAGRVPEIWKQKWQKRAAAARGQTPPSTPKGQALVALRPRYPRNCSRGGDGRQHPQSHGGKLDNWRLDGYTDSYVLLARETKSSSGTAVSVSLKVVGVVVTEPAVESGDMSPVVQSSVNNACEEPLCPR